MEEQREFLREHYMETDGPDFYLEFITYLENVLKVRRWDAMSDHSLYLQGAKKAIKEVIEEIKFAYSVED